MLIRNFMLACALTVFAIAPVNAENAHPRLLLSPADVELIRQASPLPAGFARALQEARADADRYLETLPDVPVPRDAGGGYTHEQHKRNATTIQNAGILFQLTGEAAYANLARDILLAYSELYPTLSEHPQQKNQSPGLLFWQSLNEAVWLVTAIQGYDAIYDTLATDQKERIESNLLRRMVSFISDEAPQTFDRIHNHGTWAVAAVGMTGYVIGDQDYVEKALYGLKRDGSAGFIKQLDQLFSPDGFYSEGPYYQRYALMPFLLFANVIQRNDPQRDIFGYRDGVLLKAVDAVIQMSYDNYFFPINDALKDKGLDTLELCYGVSIAYSLTGEPGLLSIAEMQDRIVLTGDGFRLAVALESGLAQLFAFESVQLRDGPDGAQGALSILRSDLGANGQALVFKATGQGLGHGHFDKLSWLFYDNGNEIVTDYGAARFLNVEEKDGGRYLPENDSWAKQTVAHNTLVVDGNSHFDGDWKHSQKYYPSPLFFEANDRLGITAARMEDAYQGVVFSRTLTLLKETVFPAPVVLDVLKVESNDTHQYDLPLHFNGHITYVSHPLSANTVTLSAAGEENGYEHLWLRATSQVSPGETFQVTWLKDNRFYTWSVLAGAAMEVLFTETGARDPDFNLRTEPGLILRVRNASDFVFVSLLEPHGEYNGSREYTTASSSHVGSLQAVSDGGNNVVRIIGVDGDDTVVALSWNPDPANGHSVEIDGRSIEWSGFYDVTGKRENVQ